MNDIGTTTNNPEVKRILGTEGDMGAMLGLDAEWAKRAIAANGNYGEIFAANIGESTPIGLARGLNAQWTQGGLMYAPPFADLKRKTGRATGAPGFCWGCPHYRSARLRRTPDNPGQVRIRGYLEWPTLPRRRNRVFG